MGKMEHFLIQKTTQEMALKPAMLHSLRMLALTQTELEMQIKKEIELNPLLEIQEEEDELLKQDTPAVDEDIESKENEDDDSEGDEELKKTIEELKEFSEILDEWSDYHRDNRNDSRTREFPEVSNTDSYHSNFNEKIEDLFNQIEKLPLNEDELSFVHELLENIDEFGFLPSDLDIYILANDYMDGNPKTKEFIERVNEIHKMVLNLDPKGIAARTIPESLLAQLDPNDDDFELLTLIIEHHFDDLINRRFQQITKELSITIEELSVCKSKIMLLNPKPGLQLINQLISYVLPDVIIRRIEDDFVVYVNDTNIPRLTLNRRYRNMIATGRIKDREFLDFLRDKLSSAKFLIRSIYMRTNTILRVTRSIIDHQKDYFYNYSGILKPLTYSIIADDVGVSESTISRVVKDKFADTPFGIVCLKDFFTTSAGRTNSYEEVSKQNVLKLIERIIDSEDKGAPFSDEEIANELRKINIIISRRVVAKYRENLGILNSRLRRKME